ncbi:Predicted secreted protein [Gemmobacter megaterium]|uniref:Predicted secreted protein n=1 Tax=Gemmobacter megaterium TaxID=1086013 RepID=A0A1N7MG96_9RHOB|nr:DUF1467 family protein [Gemmobacter megaterium]GGE06897.1 hypothetical protein GCM10011345_10700 [Gemmobacter megaterium]SIS85123.1 Predicted secreted protein [Gemmobacter megaterium]
MSISAAIVLFAVCWFMVFFIVLPLRLITQDDAGEVVPGTPRSAPAGFVVKRKAKITTVAALLVWAAIYIVITQGWITVRDFDVMGRLPPPAQLD